MKLNEKVDQLITLLVNERDFSRAMTYFFDEVSMDVNFMPQSKPLKNKNHKSQIESMIQVTSEQALSQVAPVQGAHKPKAKFVEIQILEKYQLVHGLYNYAQYSGIMFYFLDLQMGMTGINNIHSNSGRVFYARIQAQPVTDKDKNFQFDRSGYKH